MKIRMMLLSDCIFGSGEAEAGGADLSVQLDADGFPFFKGSTFKGLFRETLEQYLDWTYNDQDFGDSDREIGGDIAMESSEGEEKREALKKTRIDTQISRLLGESGSDEDDERKLVFSDFTISQPVRKRVLMEAQGVFANEGNTRGLYRELVTESMTHQRTFTRLSEEGTVSPGSLRKVRCVNQGLSFSSTIVCSSQDEELVRDVLSMIKWVGSLRNRGFGKIKLVTV